MVMHPLLATPPDIASLMAHLQSCRTIKDAAPATPYATSVLPPWAWDNMGYALALAHANFAMRKYLRPCARAGWARDATAASAPQCARPEQHRGSEPLPHTATRIS